MSKFSDFNLDSWLINQLQKISVIKPTKVQKKCIPEILKGKHCMGCAKTGHGKTMCFALPILHHLAKDPHGFFAIILTPTRELAFQIADQFSMLGKAMSLRCSVIVGGIDIVNQGKELKKKPHIIIATPGRLADHFSKIYIRNEISLQHIRFLVFDEADRLLNGQFDEQLQVILSNLPENRQNLYFTATISDNLRNAIKNYTTEDMFIYEEQDTIATVNTLKQYYVSSPLDYKEAYLLAIIQKFRKNTKLPKSIIIFTNTCKKCQMLSMLLNKMSVGNVTLHSLLPQKARMGALHTFRSKKINILITTNVTSRGLDIPSVSLVINYELPIDPHEYIHRVGRTARKENQIGFAISIISPVVHVNKHTKSKRFSRNNDLHRLLKIEERIGLKLEQYELDDSNVLKIMKKVYLTKADVDINLEFNEFLEKRENIRYLN